MTYRFDLKTPHGPLILLKKDQHYNDLWSDKKILDQDYRIKPGYKNVEWHVSELVNRSATIEDVLRVLQIAVDERIVPRNASIDHDSLSFMWFEHETPEEIAATQASADMEKKLAEDEEYHRYLKLHEKFKDRR